MKKLFLFLIIVSFQITLYSQEFKLGGTLDIMTSNKYLKYEAGPGLIVEYNFQTLPFSVKGNAAYYFSEMSKENIYLNSYTYSNLNLGIGIFYYPINWAIEPFIGLGIKYNLNSISQPGMPNFIDGKMSTLRSVKNNFSSDIISGIKFAARSKINFIVEIDYTINNPEYEVILEGNDTKEVIKDNLDFNSLFIKLGLLFQL